MSAAAGLAIGAGALWLLSQIKGGASGSGVAPDASGANPAATPQNNAAKDFQTGANLVTLGIGAASTTVALLKSAGVIGGAAGGSTAAAGGASGGAGAAAPVAETGVLVSSAGFFSAGPLYLAAAIIVAVAATMIAQGVSANIMNKHYWEQLVLAENTNPVLFATTLFQKFTEKVTKWVLPNGQPLPAGWSTANGFQVINLSPAQLRQIGLACLYIATIIPQAKNDALVRYYSYMGWTPQMMANTPVMQTAAVGNAYPGKNFYATLPSNALAQILAPLARMFAALKPPTVAGNPVFDAVTAPFTFQEMHTAAVQVFGADLSRVEAAMHFTGTSKAAFLAAIEGYGGQGGSWQTFVETIGSFIGWTPQRGVFWVTNTAAPYPLDTWWLVDPATGNRMAILETHSDNILRISVPGAQVSPGVFAGHNGRRRLGRFARFGQAADYVGEKFVPGVGLVGGTTAVLGKDKAARAGHMATMATSLSTRSAGRGGGGVGLLLPVLGIGAAAFLLLRKAK